MYQYTEDINDTKVGGSESLLNYMNENCFSKDEPAVNEHHYHITRKQYNQDFTTPSMYHVDNNKSYKTNNHRCNDINFYNQRKKYNNKQFNELHNQNNTINNSEHVLNIKTKKTFIRSITSQMVSEVITITLKIIHTINMIIKDSITQKI